MSADQAELHRRAVEEFGARVRAVADDQWELATPCADWNVRQLVNHLVYENRWTVPLMAGGTIAEVGDRYEGDLLGDRPERAWDESSAEAGPTASATFGVPASNRHGMSFQVVRSISTSRIISPPPRNGGMASSRSSRAHRPPMPVGPSILWPVKP